MAILRSGHLSLEIIHNSHLGKYVEYEVHARWRDRPVFADDILKRSPEGWANRSPGSMLGCEYGGCCFLDMFDHLFATREAAYVSTLEPDITLAIYPDLSFPFLPSHWTMVSVSPEHQEQIDADAAARDLAGGIRDTDSVQLIIAFDAYQLDGCGAYYDEGPAFHMRPRWGDLRRFAGDLRVEFAAFRARHGLENLMDDDEDDEQ